MGVNIETFSSGNVVTIERGDVSACAEPILRVSYQIWVHYYDDHDYTYVPNDTTSCARVPRAAPPVGRISGM